MGQISRTAVLSEDKKYRYLLARVWDKAKPSVLFVMLNPSTADAEVDDNTIRRCIDFAQRWGYGGLVVVNLYALRATDPKELWRVKDPVGPQNDQTIAGLAIRFDKIVCAWGANAKPERANQVLSIIAAVWKGNSKPAPVFCLGTTQAGEPLHPLRLAADTPLQKFAVLDRVHELPLQTGKI